MDNNVRIKFENIIRHVGYGEGFNNCLVCPVCGCLFVHPIAVRVIRAKETAEITNEGIFIRETENPRRGVIIELEYVCENGHHGVITLSFHEGSTYVGHKELPELKYYEWKTIWRN